MRRCRAGLGICLVLAALAVISGGLGRWSASSGAHLPVLLDTARMDSLLGNLEQVAGRTQELAASLGEKAEEAGRAQAEAAALRKQLDELRRQQAAGGEDLQKEVATLKEQLEAAKKAGAGGDGKKLQDELREYAEDVRLAVEADRQQVGLGELWGRQGVGVVRVPWRAAAPLLKEP